MDGSPYLRAILVKTIGANPILSSIEYYQRLVLSSTSSSIKSQTMNSSEASFRSPSVAWFVAISLGMYSVFLCAWHPIPENSEKEGFIMFAFHSYVNFIGRERFKVLFYASVAAHALEAIAAGVIALQLQYSTSDVILWTIQTLWLGYPSFRLLLAQRNKKRKSL